MKTLLILSLTAMLLIAGCTGTGTNPTDIAKGTQIAQSFLNEYPNANVVAAYFNEASMASLLSDLQQKCGTQIASSDYYKVTINDASKDLDVIIWVDAKSQTPVCAIKTAPNSTVIQPNPVQAHMPSTENGLPDLIVSNVVIEPDSPTLDDTLNITLTIENIGTATAYPVEYVVAAYGNQGKLLRSNTDDQRVSLEPKGKVTYTVVINAAEIPSDHLLRVAVNPAYAGHYTVLESNYDNNIFDTNLNVANRGGDVNCVPKACDMSNCRIQDDGCGNELYCTCRPGSFCSNTGDCELQTGGSTIEGFGQLRVQSPFSLSVDGKLLLTVENMIGGSVTLLDVIVSRDGVNYQCDLNPDVTLDTAQTKAIECSANGWTLKSVGQSYSLTLTIDYMYQSNLFRSTGTINGEYSESSGPKSSGFGQVMVLPSWSITPDGSISLLIQNRVGGPISITRLEANIDGVESSCDLNPNLNLDTGLQSPVTCNLAVWSQKSSGQSYAATMIIRYIYQGMDFLSAGTITGKYS
jgi:hypothetical protein